MGMALDVSVVICTYSDDRWADLLSAVASVRAQTLPPREIVIVVDHNQPLLDRVIRSISDVVAAENREARGLSGARNSGVAVSRGEVITFLDDDAIAEPDWLAQLAAGYEEDPRVLGVGGPVEPLWQEGRPRWFPEELDWVVGCSFRGMPRTAASVRALLGCNMSFRRQVFDTIGGFRSGMGRVGTRPLAGEETEFCIRASQRWPEGRWLYETRATVTHQVPASRASYQYFRSRCYCEGLSKALLSESVGGRDGLAAERSYTSRTLPRAIVREVTYAILRIDVTGLARAATIVAGLTFAGMGYMKGALLDRFGRCERLSDEGVAVQPASLS